MHPIELPTPSNSQPLLPASATHHITTTKADTSDARSTRSSSSNRSNSSSAILGLNEASSSEELAALLQRTYASLRAKEKDLRLAAHVGRALLENNLELKAKQESLLLQQRSRHYSSNSSSSKGLEPPDSPELIMQPSTSILTRTYNTHATASRILERVNSADSHGSSNSSNGMRLISRDDADLAIAEMLVEKNNEIERLIDSTLAHHSACQEADTEKHLLLQNEIARLQSQLELAAQTIEQLENQKQQQQQDASAAEEDAKDAAVAAAIIDQEQLAAKLDQLQAEHECLLAGKNTAQHRLDQTTRCLNLWQQQLADLETIDEKYKDQQNAYCHQLAEIVRLTGTIEEYRTVVADVQDDTERVILSDDGDSDLVVVARQHRQSSSPVMAPSKSNLFSELERARTTSMTPSPLAPTPRQHSPGPSSIVAPPSYFRRLSSSSPISPSPIMHPLTVHHHSSLPSIVSSTDSRRLPPQRLFPSSYSTSSSSSSIMSPLDDLPQSLYTNLSVCSSKPLRPKPPIRCVRKRLVIAAPRPFLENQSLILRLPQQVAYKIWRWYRFSLIMFLAILINLWQGPDAVLEK